MIDAVSRGAHRREHGRPWMVDVHEDMQVSVSLFLSLSLSLSLSLQTYVLLRTQKKEQLRDRAVKHLSTS
jgi:hypothetical protein